MGKKVLLSPSLEKKKKKLVFMLIFVSEVCVKFLEANKTLASFMTQECPSQGPGKNLLEL